MASSGMNLFSGNRSPFFSMIICFFLLIGYLCCPVDKRSHPEAAELHCDHCVAHPCPRVCHQFYFDLLQGLWPVATPPAGLRASPGIRHVSSFLRSRPYQAKSNLKTQLIILCSSRPVLWYFLFYVPGYENSILDIALQRSSCLG